MNPPTEKQRRLLQFVHDYTCRTGFAPSHREMCRCLGIASTNGVAEHLERLEAKGLVFKRDAQTAGLARTVRLTPKGQGFVQRWAFAAIIECAGCGRRVADGHPCPGASDQAAGRKAGGIPSAIIAGRPRSVSYSVPPIG